MRRTSVISSFWGAGDRVLDSRSARTVAPPVLERARRLTQPALRAAVERLDPGTCHVGGYHFGWLSANGVLSSGGPGCGKAIRPALALLGAGACGAAEDVAMPGAVAVELVHGFSLLHDDLMDGDERRRHRAAAWTVFGPARAILAGDGLLVLAIRVLLEAGGAGATAAQRLVAASGELIAGQAADLSFEGRLDVTVDECRAMAAAKTGALLSCAASIGAVLAGAPAERVDALAGFGAHLGLAFQAVDDLLGIWGLPEATGKPIGSDLRNGKSTLPMTAALTAGNVAARRLAHLLADGLAGEEDVVLAAKLVDEAGGRAWTEAEAARELDLALGCLAATAAPDAVHAELAALARFVTARER